MNKSVSKPGTGCANTAPKGPMPTCNVIIGPVHTQSRQRERWPRDMYEGTSSSHDH
jgi:hypothetical protein